MNSQALPAARALPAASMRMISAVTGCGVVSIGLLAAALVFAHHWGALADTIVAGWAVATVASATGVWFLGHRRTLTGRSWLAIRVAGAAVLAAVGLLLFAGVVWAAGGDPSGYCGGG